MNRLLQNLSQLTTAMSITFIPSLVKKIPSRGTSWQIGEMTIVNFSEAPAEIRPFDRFPRTMAQNAQNHARMYILGLECLILTSDPIYPQNVKFWP